MNHFLKSLQKRLSNLNQKNKLLFHSRISTSEVDLSQLDFTGSISKSYDLLAALLSSEKRIPLAEEVDPRDKSANQFSNQLKKIVRANERILTESGSHCLFLGWPYVEGKLLDETIIRSPLFFVPISIHKEQQKWFIQRVPGEPVKLNETFLLAYGYFNGIDIPEDLYEIDLLDLGSGLDTIKRNLYDYLEKSVLTIHFNQELFTEQLLPIEKITRQEANQSFQSGKLKLFNKCAFGIFPQNDSHLITDYSEFIEKHDFNDPESYFEKKILNYEVPQDHEQNTFTIFKLDAAQEHALKKVKNGHSLVVQGPPGSGKSQLIGNLIADFTSRGKKVLVLSQKKVALKVIEERLSQKKVASFAALVHDFNADRSEVYQHINRQIEEVEGYEKQNNNLDTVLLEREFLQISKQIDQIAEELKEVKTSLFNDGDFGISAKELYLKCNITESPVLGQEAVRLKFNELADFVQDIKIHFPYIKSFLIEEHAWAERKAFSNFTGQDKNEIHDRLKDLKTFKEHFNKRSGEILSDNLGMEDAFWVLEKEQYIKELLKLIKSEKIFHYFKHYLTKPQADLDWLILQEKKFMDLFKDDPELSLSIEEVNHLLEAFEDLRTSEKNFINKANWFFFNKNKYSIKKALIKNNLKWNKKDVKALQQKVDNRLNLEHLFTELKECNWLLDIPKKLEYEAIEKWFDRQSIAIEAVKIAQELRSLKEHLDIFENSYEATLDKTDAILSLCRKVPLKKSYWQDYLTENQIARLFRDDSKIDELANGLNDFEDLVEWDHFFEKLPKHKKDILLKLINNFEIEESQEFIAHLENQVYLSWIITLETKYPALSTYSSPKLTKLVEELNYAVEKKNMLSRDILLLKLKEKTHQDLEYNRLNNRVTYRELKHQVTKKKKIWPLRKMFQEFSEEIFKLIPCWLCSPETVGAVFPCEEVFDLVIFDEASQCFLENGFPGTFRGKQVVICGDSQQLQPTNIYNVRFDAEEENPDLEVDSLLDFSERYLESVMLTGHYRSKYRELINFSNQHFYKNKLEFIPSKEDFNLKESAIEYIKVPGYWDANTNKTEAEKITELVLEKFRQDDTDIGVVCFNQKQQELITDMLSEAFERIHQPVPKDVFVKNIENVQGDERKTIIFSITYAPSLSGKFQMNFGLLNLDGGENRLNVAVSRAKEKIIIVSSIWPSQLNTDNTAHSGPKLLKSYLEYAHSISENRINKTLKPESLESVAFLSKTIKDTLEPQFKLEHLFFSDLGSREEEKYEKLILTDDNIYHKDESVKSIFCYRPTFLERKGWKVKQVYSRNYWKKKPVFLENISSFLTN